MTASTRRKVAVVGSGPAGLAAAAVLRNDGFDVSVFTSDRSAGGVWSRERIYPGLIYQEFAFSAFPYTAEELKTARQNERIDARSVASYYRRYADHHLPGCITYQTTLVAAQRPAGSDRGWELTLANVNGEKRTETFDALVNATGSYNTPDYPTGLADTSLFDGETSHSARLYDRHQSLVDAARKTGRPVLVIGGGKSATDTVKWFWKQGLPVVIITKRLECHPAIPAKKLPHFLRRSRLGLLFSPRIALDSAIQRFLHTTTLGAYIIRRFWRVAEGRCEQGIKAKEWPGLRHRPGLYYHEHVGGPIDRSDPDNFINLVQSGRVRFIEAYAQSYGSDRTSVVLDNGETVSCSAIVFATGFKTTRLSPFSTEQIGLSPSPPTQKYKDRWQYRTLSEPAADVPLPLFLHSITPVANWDQRDLAFAGVSRVLAPGYCAEAVAHWISAYLSGELSMTKDEAKEQAELENAWLRRRWPDNPCYSSDPSTCSPGDGISRYSGLTDYTDLLLKEIGLPTKRPSGWLWFFKPITENDMADVGPQRDQLRAARSSL